MAANYFFAKRMYNWPMRFTFITRGGDHMGIWPGRTGRKPGLHLIDAVVLVASVAIITTLAWWVL